MNNNYTLITGASSGIGKALAEEFAAHGKNLILVARNKEKLETVKHNILSVCNIDIKLFSFDLSDPVAIDKLHSACKSNQLMVECLINNAGIGAEGEFTDIALEKQQNIIQLNIFALVKMCYLFLPDMKLNGNGIVANIASTTAFVPFAYEAVYSSSKAFVMSFSQALHEEYKKYGITVATICPGVTNTDFFASAGFRLQNFNGADPKDFAKFAYRAIQNRKVFSIHRFSNKLIALWAKIFPRNFVRIVSAKMSK